MDVVFLKKQHFFRLKTPRYYKLKFNKMDWIHNETFEHFRKNDKDYKINQAKILLKKEGYIITRKQKK